MRANITAEKLAGMIDHTLLKPFAVIDDFRKLCREADTYGFKMVAINPAWTSFCSEELKNSPVHVGAAIAFPLGQTTPECKLFETKDAIKKGADEIDYVINIPALKEKNDILIKREMKSIVEICRSNKVISKVILETCYLTDEEIIRLSEIAAEVEPDFIKTSTGFGNAGATVKHVRLMKKHCGEKVQVKAAGGIRDLKTALAMVEAGATRLGTSSGIAIVEEYKKHG